MACEKSFLDLNDRIMITMWPIREMREEKGVKIKGLCHKHRIRVRQKGRQRSSLLGEGQPVLE